MTVMSIKLRRECMNVVAHYGAVRLTTSQFEDIMFANPQLEEQLIISNFPGITKDREDLLSALARHVVGRKWPCNLESQAVADNSSQITVRHCLPKVTL